MLRYISRDYLKIFYALSANYGQGYLADGVKDMLIQTMCAQFAPALAACLPSDAIPQIF